MQLIVGTGKQRAAKTSRISIANGGSFLTYASFDIDLKIDDLPTGNFESFNTAPAGWASGQSFDEGISGFVGASFSGGGDWDAGLAPYGSPPGLYPRDDGPRQQFYISRLDNTFWDFNPYTRIRTSKVGANVKDKVAFSYTGMSQGYFAMPTVSV